MRKATELAAQVAPAGAASAAAGRAGVWLAAGAGAALALLVVPMWLPGLERSLTGGEPKASWYLARASGFVAFALLTGAMAMGLLITGRSARTWPGPAAALAWHQHLSLLALSLGLFHGVVLLGDRYMAFDPAQLVLPFATVGYRPFAVGIGQIGWYLLAAVYFSFDLRARIGNRWWRRLHYLSVAAYLLALGHGLTSGTDAGEPWAGAIYWGSATLVGFLVCYRVLLARQLRAGAGVPAAD